MEQIVRTALIGFGGMGKIYAQMIYAGMVPELKLTGICCRNETGRIFIQEQFPAVTVYPDAEVMAAHAQDYDAVIIVTPHTSHVELGLRFAALGKHLLLDKPAGIDAGSVEKLVNICREKEVRMGMIFQNRYLPAFRKAKEMLDSGVLGTLHRAVWVCNNWYRSPAYHRSASWRSSWVTECGGLMINQNPHYVDMWNWFFGLPDRIYVDMQFGRYNDFLVDDGVDIQLSYDNGFHGTMISATGEAPGVNRLEIWGSRGRLTVEDTSRLYFDENEMSTEEFGRVNQEKFAGIPHAVKEIELEEAGNLYGQVLSNFGQHILVGMPLNASGMDGLRQVQLANAVYLSGWEERRVALPVNNETYLQGLAARQEAERKRK